MKRAFTDAKKASDEKEFERYKELIGNNVEAVCLTAAVMTGMDDVEKMAKLLVEGGSGFIFAEYTKGLVMTAFHIGYTAAREDGV